MLPRAKGHLIWILTRHDALPDAVAATTEWELKGTGYNRCVNAINVILMSIQSQKEWIAVFGAIRQDINYGGHNPNRRALDAFYQNYAGRKPKEIDDIKNRLPENIGWNTVWNDCVDRHTIIESQALLARYETHKGILPSNIMCFNTDNRQDISIA